MPRKKTAKPVSESTDAGVGTGTISETRDTAPLARPDWVDGTPVTAEGEFIREGFAPPSPQMQFSRDEGVTPPPDTGADETHGKNWGDPYKSIFTCPEMGFTLGENRRFKQRVFHFVDRPSDEILTELKENNFVYRGAEKAWTIPANPDTRKLTDELARKWAGPNYVQGIER